MPVSYNKILRKGLSNLLILALMTTGLFSCQNTAYADSVILSDQTYYHLDMGVQLAYNLGCDWGSEQIYNSSTPLSVHTTITFNSDVEVLDTYPLNSTKGSSFDFNGEMSSHNIPDELGQASWAYGEFYTNYVSNSMIEGNCNSSGRNVSFNYMARLSTTFPLEVVEYGKYGNDQEIYRLFGGKAALEDDQPEIAEAMETALQAGANGTAGTNKLYLIFCPNVIEYKKYITVGDLEAKLELPSSAKQGESYTASDDSIIDSSLTVEKAVLEKHYGDGNWEEVAVWNGPGLPGRNTGGSANESCDEIGTITYRLTVTATNGQVDADTKTIRITDSREVEGEAILELPAYTYEGHPALAKDVSVFTVDGVDYSARRAYEEDVADNKFIPLPTSAGSAARESLTTANVVFPRRGNYHVKLEVNTISGNTMTDTKPITVRKTPYILDNLGGFQKQNRKQILDIAVATYPEKPITDYSVELTDLKTGQSITLTQAQPQQNNATIKTRALTTNGDAYWTNFQLMFLTKTPAYDPDHPHTAQEFRYTIYMKDSKGDTDTVQKTFTVAPDLPPNAQITIQDSFIRNKGTNIAEIEAEDSTATDGDQLQRTWTVKGVNVQSLPGFQDRSFGSRQRVKYDKTGVGKEDITLSVKDVWIEPTLEEYISPSDYLSAATTAATNVINIAPTVRLEPVQTEEADIVLLAPKTSQAGIKAGINSLKAALIEAGIDANLQVLPVTAANSNGYRNVSNFEWPVSINCATCRSGSLLFDSDHVYRIESIGRTVSGYQEVCTHPHTIYAMKPGDPLTGETPSTAWSYTVNESSGFSLLLDAEEKYVYILCSDTGKTILLNQSNGAYVTTLNVLLPSGALVASKNDNIYFLQSGSIQKYNAAAGTLTTVANAGGSLGRLQNGKMVFVKADGGYQFNLVEFDLNTETLTYTAIPELNEAVWTSGPKSAVTPTDMDTTGKVCFYQTLTCDNDTTGIVLWLADYKSQRVYNLGQVTSLSDGRGTSLGFVKDETGKAKYMYHSICDDNSTTANTRRYFYLYLYTLGDGDTPPSARTIYAERDNRQNYNGISYARYHTQENAIYLMQGSDFGWNGLIQGVQCRIQLPSWTTDFYQYNWNWDAAEECGTATDYYMYTQMSQDQWMGVTNRVRVFKNAITGEQARESVMTRLADFRDGIVHIIEDNFTGDLDALVEKTKELLKQKEILKIISTGTNEPGTLERNFHLKSGQTYYYEYEIKDASGKETHAAAPDITIDKENVYTGTENLGSYVITKAYEEDFNDSELTPFFTLIGGSLNGGLTTPTMPKGSKNYNIASSATVTFTVPAGKKAIAVMDVAVYNADLATHGWKSGAYINGQRYDRRRDSDYNVTNYTHPYLLKEGENTIQAYCCWYGRGTAGYYTTIDNLKIYFLEDSNGSSVNSFSSVKEADGWHKASGKFTVPLGGYRAQTAAHYSDWPPGFSSYSSTTQNYTTNYDFTIPAGMIGRVFASFTGYSSRSDDAVGPLATVYSSYNHIGTEHDYYYHYVSNGESFMVGDYQGLNQFTARGDYRSSCGFSRLETFVFPDNLLGKTDFFFEGDKVYSISDKYDGKVHIRLNFPADNTDGTAEHLMKNIKLYYLKGGKRVYLQNDNLDSTNDLGNWTANTGMTITMSTEPAPEKEEEAPPVYKKGQLVRYNIFYDDYENDPSKTQYWRYTHTPYNDGPHPQAACILDEEGNVISSSGAILAQSILRFYIDGKYTVEHWQEDNTNNTQYDKLSNVESLTFYIEGGGAAPWITSIKTIPAKVKEGDPYQLQIGVDDAEKDVLRLTTELYKDKKLIYTHRQTNISADTNGVYPLITTGYPPNAEPGKYEVVCTVRDWAGAGIGSYQFTVVSEGKITGFVNHTDQWDENRKRYNLKRFSEEVNRPMQLSDYLDLPTPRMRGTNLFWSGEKIMLLSETEGKPWKVDVQIQSVSEQGKRKSTGYSTELSNTGKKTTAGAEIWEGSLWDKGMINKWGRKTPEQLLFLFTAYYSGDTTKVHEVTIIVDSRQDYWQLHRLW